MFHLQYRDPGQPSYDIPSLDSDTDDELPQRGRRYLIGSRRTGEDNSGWVHRTLVKTEDALVRFFENEVRCTTVACVTLTDIHYNKPNDFLIKRYTKSDAFRQIWMDGPGDHPSDIRARRFIGQMIGQDPRDSGRNLVYRCEFYCNQLCLLAGGGVHPEESDSSGDDGDEGMNSASLCSQS